LNFNRPRNETETHFLLKEISKYILWGWGYNKLGTEVGGMWDYDISKLFRKQGKSQKDIIDCVGLKKVSLKRGKFYYDMKAIEAKASLSDYKNGFCGACAKSYIIAPVGIIPIDQLPDKIGLIEVNLDILELQKWSQRIPDMKGVELVRKANKRIDSRFKDEESYKKWCQDSLERVSYRCGSELLFWRNYIEFSK
jgi:hypothetical protein